MQKETHEETPRTGTSDVHIDSHLQTYLPESMDIQAIFILRSPYAMERSHTFRKQRGLRQRFWASIKKKSNPLSRAERLKYLH